MLLGHVQKIVREQKNCKRTKSWQNWCFKKIAIKWSTLYFSELHMVMYTTNFTDVPQSIALVQMV